MHTNVALWYSCIEIHGDIHVYLYLLADEQEIDPPSGLKTKMVDDALIVDWDKSPIHSFGYYRLEIRNKNSNSLLYSHNYYDNDFSTSESEPISLALSLTVDVKLSIVTYCNISSDYATITAHGTIGECLFILSCIHAAYMGLSSCI